MQAKTIVYGSTVYSLLYNSAIPGVIVSDICNNIGLTLGISGRRKTAATGGKSERIGVLNEVPLSFDEVTAEINFLPV